MMNLVSTCVLLVMVERCHGALSTAHQALFTANGWTITVSGVDYLFAHTGVVDGSSYTVGSFPSAGNPNTIQTQNYQIYVPKDAAKQSTSTCTGMGYIGMAVNGAVFFNPLTAEDKDAVTGDCSETFDDCQGHPDMQGVYHYHQNPSCVTTSTNDEPIGIALDGFLIYKNVDESGNTLTSTDLDSCGGRTGTGGDYRYHLQSSYPYTVGCYYGTLSPRQNANTECSSLVACGANTLFTSNSLMFLLSCVIMKWIV